MEQRRLHKAAEGRDQSKKAQTVKRKEREAKRLAREQRHVLKIARQYEREEGKRREGAEVARLAGEMLKASSTRRNGLVTVMTKKTRDSKKL